MFARGMKNKMRHRVYVDLFCGPGKVQIRGTNKIMLGSPLLALDIPDKFTEYVFCDEDEANLGALKERVSSNHPEIVPCYIVGDCNERIEDVLAHIPQRNALTFCFVDPYNLGIQFDTVRRLAQRPVDFLMSLMLGVDALRNSKLYIGQNSTRIENFLGRSDWRELWDKEGKNGKSFPRFLAEAFVGQMIGLGYRDDALKTMVEVRSDDHNLWLYHLAFFSRHERGYDFWEKGKRYATDQLELELSKSE